MAVHSLSINLTSFCKRKNIYKCLLKVSPVIALFYPKVWVKMIPGATGKGELENTIIGVTRTCLELRKL